MSSNIIEFSQISKIYGLLKANDNLSFQIRKQTIHALVGENGAGKSTAMKLLFGLETPTSGQIFIDGKAEIIDSPRRARELGLGMVQQHFVLASEHTALDNILFSETHSPWQILNRKQKKNEYQELASRYGFKIPWDKPVADLSVGEQQRVEILKVLQQKARILILDEPTAVLTPQEVQDFFKNLRQLRDEGCTIILITHKLKEVLSICDEVTVIRHGHAVAQVQVAETNQDQLAEFMVGRHIQWNRRDIKIQEAESEKSVLKIFGTGRMDFNVKSGEVVGIAGVEGNGQNELIERILNPSFYKEKGFGINLNEEDISNLSLQEIRKKSIAVFPEDRLHLGSVLNASVVENFILGYDWDSAFSKKGILLENESHKIVQKYLNEFDVRPPRAELNFGSFSGGNQQKIVVARELRRQPKFILASQPTRGVDIGAIEFIHEQLLKAQENGAGILLISSELDELLKLSTRILVLYKSKIVFEILRSEFNELKIGRAMGGLQ